MGEDQDPRSVPELAHAESSEVPTLGASHAAPKAHGKQRGEHAEAQPHGGYGVQNGFPTPSHPNSEAGALCPLSLVLSPRHGASYPARLAQASLEQRVEGGRVPPPAGQAAV